jgi:hypothetical protein
VALSQARFVTQPSAGASIAQVLAQVAPPICTLQAVAHLIQREGSRAELLGAVAATLPPRGCVRLDVRDPGATLSLVISAERRAGVARLRINADTDLSALPHPLAHVLPAPSGAHTLVRTRAIESAAFDFLAPDLVGPDTGLAQARETDLLNYLARVIDDDPGYRPGYRAGYRYVEPGIGRTYLADFVRLDNRSEFRDFSVTGVGLTPFSKGGFFFKGPHIDGRLLLKRARHRRRVGDVLAAAGCRVPAVAAIVTSPELKHTMLDASQLPGALIVRGFRNVFRVKQLDPVANLLMSGPEWSEPVQDHLRGATQRRCTCLSPSFFLGTRSGRRCDESSTCYRRRVELARSNARGMLQHACGRLALELGRDPVAEPVSLAEYVAWFARTMGTQLAIMRRERFLHDYRLAQTEWDDPHYLLDSLMDTNVTLLAEFADLDTGVLVDRNDTEWRDELHVSRETMNDLAAGFEGYHVIETRLAQSICETVEMLALPKREERCARRLFAAAYERAVMLPGG